MEITVISLAFPEIRERFSGTSESALSWIVSAYNDGVASLLLIGGWLSERYGHKRIVLTGVSIFLLGSVLAGFAVPSEMLIGARVVQAAGPTIGALLVEAFGWRAVFLINIPVIGVALGLGRRWLPDTQPLPGTNAVDLVSVPLAGVGAGALVLGIVQGETWGWLSAAVIGSFVVGLVLMATFAARSSRHPVPLFDLGLYRLRSYSVVNVASVFFAFAFFGWPVPLPRLIQSVWGWSVLKTGFAIAPGPLMAFFVAPPSGRMVDRIGNRLILTVCGSSGVIGMGLFIVNFGAEPQYLSDIFLPSLFIGIAAGTGFSLLFGARCATCRRTNTPWAAPGARLRFRWRSP